MTPPVRARPWCLSSPSSSFDELTEGPAREAGDEPVEERVVDEGHGNARDQDGCHDPGPVVEIAADQVGRHSDRQRAVRRARDERDRIDELVHDEREGEDHNRQDPRGGDREHDPHERPEPGATVDQRRVLELLRDRFEEPHQQPDRKRDREGRVDEDQRPEPVLEADLRDHARQGQKEECRRHQIRQEDRDAEAAAEPARQPRERVPGGDGDEQRDQHDGQPDERRVPDPAHVAGVVEEVAVVLERRAESPRLRQVVDLALRLERRHRHPEEREREQDREGHDDAVLEQPLPQQCAHVTSARRAKKSIPIVTNASSGSMKSAIAAPSPTFPELMPVWNAQVVSTCVELNGPPAVRMYGTTMSVAVKTIPKRIATSAIGSCSGSETYQNLRSPVAPSIAAASSTSLGIEAIPAMKMTVANGIVRQACTVMIDDIAARGVPSQVGWFVAETRCSLTRNQVKMLAWVS